jgi:hypothetical protein
MHGQQNIKILPNYVSNSINSTYIVGNRKIFKSVGFYRKLVWHYYYYLRPERLSNSAPVNTDLLCNTLFKQDTHNIRHHHGVTSYGCRRKEKANLGVIKQNKLFTCTYDWKLVNRILTQRTALPKLLVYTPVRMNEILAAMPPKKQCACPTACPRYRKAHGCVIYICPPLCSTSTAFNTPRRPLPVPGKSGAWYINHFPSKVK